ncbi:RNA polymerase sigma factor SigF [Streptomyces sp. RB5]|uniref:RNA polymerase sigma factor SigF n=1 Tax=Streptomyces smaragdinus TaxID=2585196 RepID=A0A7K0CPX5_9ACTN|nr:RNA polymerase sigma factor SigF [Streptomyces smaragdinus]MQY15538.1 RNA polymerase sigma factor SigF [Streptomyces smaragdinus]
MAAPWLTENYARSHRHTPGPGPAPHPRPARQQAELPPVPRPSDTDTASLREMSRVLLVRLRTLEEGTGEYSYVRNTLVELNLTLVRYAAARFRTRTESQEDIVQVGTIGLIKAINRFDPELGVEFPSFALPTIIGEIKRFFRDTSWAVRVPRRLQELRLTLAKAQTEVEQRLGRSATVAELAAHTGLDAEDVLEGLLAANGYTASSVDYQTDGDDGEGPLSDRLGYEDRRLEKVENIHALKPLVAALPERERRILSMRFGQELTQSEIGAELGISQMHVSRLLSAILARLRRQLLATD